MKFGYSVIALNTALAGVLAPAALAQTASDNQFLRHRFTAVTERQQPEYDPLPLHAGAFLVNSNLLLGALYNDNIYAQNSNTTGDTVLEIRPQVDVTSNWTSNAIYGGAFVDHKQYLENDSENVTDYSGYLGGRVDVTRSFSFGGQVNGGRFSENRYAPSAIGNASEPVHFIQTGAQATATYRFNRFKFDGNVGVQKFDFHDVDAIPGGLITVFDQDFRDVTQTEIGGRASYAISPDIAVFAQVKHTDMDYRVTTLPNRDGTRDFYQVGTNFELAAPFRGDIAVGYVQNKLDSGLDSNGLAVDAHLQWFPTQITTVTLTGLRTVFDPGLVGSTTAFDTLIGVRVDHELRRNIVLFGDISHTQDDFQDIDRKDEVTAFSTGLSYKMNRHARLEFAYTLRDQDTSGTSIFRGPKFDQNIVSVALRLFP